MLVEHEILILKRSSGLRKQCIQFDDPQKRKRKNPLRFAFREIQVPTAYMVK